jgi:hypothetical protein
MASSGSRSAAFQPRAASDGRAISHANCFSVNLLRSIDEANAVHTAEKQHSSEDTPTRWMFPGTPEEHRSIAK